MLDLAYAMAPGPAGGANGGGGILSVLPLMIGMFAIMYFLIIRPQQKQRKDREALLTFYDFPAEHWIREAKAGQSERYVRAPVSRDCDTTRPW